MAKWISAIEAPASWAGKKAWMWDGRNVTETIVPRDYSRKPEHCLEIMFRLMPPPPLPPKPPKPRT